MAIDPRAFHFTLRAIATIHTPYESKFGVPRQSGVVNALESTIVFTPEFRNKDALRGIEGYDYLWLRGHQKRLVADSAATAPGR